MNKIFNSIKQISSKDYWNRANFVEAFGFTTKLIIIFPGLLFGYQWWWLYVLAIISSVCLIWSSDIKTLPTIVIFNACWIVLASVAIFKHFI